MRKFKCESSKKAVPASRRSGALRSARIIAHLKLLAVALGKSTHQLGLFDDFSFQCHLHFHGRRAGRKVKLLAQGVQTSETAMATGRRTRSGIAEFAGVGDWRLLGKIFAYTSDVRRNVIEKPVSEAVVSRSIWIMKNEDKDFVSFGASSQ